MDISLYIISSVHVQLFPWCICTSTSITSDSIGPGRGGSYQHRSDIFELCACLELYSNVAHASNSNRKTLREPDMEVNLIAWCFHSHGKIYQLHIRYIFFTSKTSGLKSNSKNALCCHGCMNIHIFHRITWRLILSFTQSTMNKYEHDFCEVAQY